MLCSNNYKDAEEKGNIYRTSSITLAWLQWLGEVGEVSARWTKGGGGEQEKEEEEEDEEAEGDEV